ncbi:right-handed parallel beta-helix repeat-containing protein [candidate division TA06 bacterium]|uniref:Right-handed parallel beta-helix repeat-containing protein n=1 Tax=candidate division TA06 bacterium TaxID=2250710 RepID=A0A933I9D4_UNCT6|nr:right-handed parallel beta-helix repeat-containing protein [candidate division TA06 bacterium]
MKRSKFIFAFVTLLLAFGMTQKVYATNVSGDVSGTWTTAGSPYIVTGSITVPDQQTLTIEPGVAIKFNGNYQFLVSGKLIAVGTETDSIKFLSNQTTPTKGYWRDISFSAPEKGSLMKYCVVKHGGNAGFQTGPVTFTSTWDSVSIENCLIDSSAYDGLYVGTNSAPQITNCQVRNCEKYGINWLSAVYAALDNNVITGNKLSPLNIPSEMIVRLGSGLQLSGNDSNFIYVRGGSITTSGIWRKLGNLPYVIYNSGITLADQRELTIEPGVAIKFNGLYRFTVNGKLVAVGTETDSIKFLSNKATPAKGDWYDIYFSAPEKGSLMKYCVVKHGGNSGYGTGQVSFASTGDSVNIENCLIDSSATAGLYVGTNSAPKITRCTMLNSGYGVSWLSTLAGSIDNCAFSNNDRGISVTANAALKPRYCAIAQNDTGVYVNVSSTTLKPDFGTATEPGYNTIKGNAAWNFYNNSGTTYTLNAIGNDWGLYDSTSIDNTIYDDPTTGRVDFMPFLGPLWSDVNYATAYNNGKKLARKAGADELHLTFQRKGRVCYSSSADAGANWLNAIELADPGYAWGPCIAMNASSQPCIAYPKATEIYTGLQFAKYDGANWQFAPVILQTHMVGGFNVSPPSMVINASDTVHLAVETSQGTADGYWWFAWYYKFAANDPSTIIERKKIDSMFVHDEPWLKSPSIAMDPLGNCHIVYTKSMITVNPGDVYYAEQAGGVWQAPVNLSNSEATSSEASIEAYGDSLHVTWVEATSDVEKEVWRMSKEVGKIAWEPSWFVSNTPTQLSEVPVTFGGITFWSEYEGTNYETDYYSPTLGTRVNLSNTTTESVHPQGVVSFDASKLYSVWTESYNGLVDNAIAEIKFGTVTLPAKLAYYAVGVGSETASGYTIYRDGDTTYPSGISVDYAADELVYNLPYLNLGYDYTLQVVGYHESSGKWNEQVKLDGKIARVLKVTAGVPDTVRIPIPENYYADDKKVELKVRKLTGDYAAVSNITLYRTEIATKPGKSSGGAQFAEGAVTPLALDFKLNQNIPNPFSGKTNISYQSPQNGKVTLKVYNLQGQVVKVLVDKEQPAGYYNVAWDGKSDAGKKISNGVYFYRLTTDSGIATKKLVFVK